MMADVLMVVVVGVIAIAVLVDVAALVGWCWRNRKRATRVE